MDSQSFDGSEIIQVFFAYWLFLFPFIVVAGVIIALPVSRLMVTLRIRGVFCYALVGSLCGSAVSFAIISTLAGQMTLDVFFAGGSIGFLPGMVAGIMWWLMIDRFEHEQLSVGK